MTKFFKFQRGNLSAVLLVLMLLLTMSGCSSNDGYAPNSDSNSNTTTGDVNWDFYNALAREFIYAVASGDFDVAVDMFNEPLVQGFGTSGLQEAWGEIVALSGEFVEIHGIENAMVEQYFISGVILRHMDFAYAWNIVFSEEGVIHGLSGGGTISLAHIAPTAAQRNGFTDYSIVIGENTNFPLSGILSMPNDITERVPAVVIVHGSGPHDMDGTVYGNKPYRDIAEFLASNGIAVIRHDKRFFAHAERVADEFGGSITAWHESIEDAILATEMLRADYRIDENRIFIIGHSFGGMLAPRLHVNGGDFAGLILMAATPRCPLEVIIEQIMSSVHSGYSEGFINEAEKADMLAELEILAEQLRSIIGMTVEEAGATHIPALGTWAYYWKDMQLHSFVDYAKDIAVPILVLQGGSDFQMLADVEFVLLQEVLAEHTNVTFVLYEGLNHLFMPTIAMNFVQHAMEITQSPSHVDTQVLRDIVNWILGGGQ